MANNSKNKALEGAKKGERNEGHKSQFQHSHFGSYTKIGNDYYKNTNKKAKGRSQQYLEHLRKGGMDKD